jgi:two-component system cell cycle response regulator DivK
MEKSLPTRVLYIEDNQENRLLMKRVLEAEGFSVYEASDGLSGLNIAQAERPDIILMDIQIPGIDGYESTSRIKNDIYLCNIPVIALTANVMERDKEKAVLAGCDGYIEKPIDVDRIANQIREFLVMKPKIIR